MLCVQMSIKVDKLILLQPHQHVADFFLIYSRGILKAQPPSIIRNSVNTRTDPRVHYW